MAVRYPPHLPEGATREAILYWGIKNDLSVVINDSNNRIFSVNNIKNAINALNAIKMGKK